METKTKTNKDSRWFIWTIVFLVVAGVSLVTYISYFNISDQYASTDTIIHHVHAQK